MTQSPTSPSVKERRGWSGAPQFVSHQIAWWSCVLFMGYTGPVVMLGFLALHLYMTRELWREEALIAVVATLVGVAVDNSLHLAGAVSYVGELTIGYSPAWLVAIWLGFGPTLRHSQSIFVRSWLNTLLVGFIGGPLAYYGGVKLARLSVDGLDGWLSVSVAWALAMSILYLVIRKIGAQGR